MSCDALEELLVCEGWPIDGKQLSDFIGEPLSKIQDVKKLKRKLLDADMREFALPSLSDRIDKQLGEFKGPLVVQVVRPRNVSYPKYSEATHTDGLIKVQLSDGFSSVQALQFEPIAKLNAETPPGTKVRLAGRIPIENGMLLINGTNCQVLGGSVEKMVEKWNLEKKSMRTTESSAPKWIQFSKQRLPQSALPVNATNKMFRANDVINGLSNKTNDDRGDDFSAARKAQIEQVVENSSIKKFARSQLRPKPLENSASTSYNNSNKKEPMYRHFGRDDARNLSPARRPSNPPTLFDFVQSKVSLPDEPLGQQNCDKNLEVQQFEINRQNAEIQGLDRTRRNKFEKGVVSGSRNQQHDSSGGSRTIEISNSNRYRRQHNWRPERERNCATNLASDGFRSNYVDDYQSVVAVNRELAGLQLSSTDNEPVDAGKDHKIPQSALFFGNRNHDYHQNTVYQPLYEQQRQQPFDNMVMNRGMPTWKIGDKCLAPWSDGQFYPSTLVSMGPADMCTIEYDEYGNRSSVPVGVLLPFQTF
uniref:Survival of motor neuron-related-splicing factor 30 n=1 Tax=Setaria digitata TaxID=48799 RepID=A0A915PQL8_9BILA